MVSVLWGSILSDKMIVALLNYSLILFVIAILAGLILREGKKASYLGSILTCTASILLLTIVFIETISLLTKGMIITVSTAVPLINMPIRIDGLSLVLITVIALLGLASSLYTPRYMEYYEKLAREGYFIALFSTFIASMLLIVLTSDIIWFIFMWEVMTFSSYLLIIWEYVEEYVMKAGWKYFVTMHFLSTLPLMIGIIALWETTGSTSMDVISARISRLPTELLAILYTLFIIGFCSKAGVVPIHFWLPDAHPAAPSNVSALLSGAMIKVSVYGLLRFCCHLLPVNMIVGYVVAFLGTLSLTIGTLYALKQTDTKKLLAYHSVGQMGYIWLGLGAGMVLLSQGNTLGFLGIIAGLYHLINHAAFKGLLFLSAGSILYRAHTRDLNILGGLNKIMPWTALFTLIAALSISGVPPLNGFMSKWLIYEVTFSSANGLLAFFGIMALFISAATLASFIKFYTASFTGELKVKMKERAEVPGSMLAGMGILAVVCILWGVAPVVILPLLNVATQAIRATIAWKSVIEVSALWVNFQETLFSPIILLAFIAVVFSLSILAIKPHRYTIVRSWDTGVGIDEYEYRDYKLIAKHYYIAFEEAIHSLYYLGEKLCRVGYGLLYNIIKVLLGANMGLARACTKLCRVVRDIGATVDRKACEVYLDEMIISPLVSILNALSRFLGWTVLRTDINTFLVYSALYVAIMTLIAILFMGLMKP